MKRFTLLLLATTLLGCARFHGIQEADEVSLGSDSIDIVDVQVTGRSAFEKGFYAFVNKQGCVKCHDSIINPKFASGDINTAYAAAKGNRPGTNVPLVDFNNPSASIFIIYAGNAHCGDVPCSNPAVRPEVQKHLEDWATAELTPVATPTPAPTPVGATPTPTPIPTPTPRPKHTSSSLAIPVTLPNLMQAPAVLRFPLSQLNPPVAVLSNAIFELEVQLIAGTTYRLNRPKIAGNTAAVTITGIHVYVKAVGAAGLGMEDVNQGSLWTNVTVMAPIFALPNPLPVGPLAAPALRTDALGVIKQSATEVMTLVFDSIQ